MLSSSAFAFRSLLFVDDSLKHSYNNINSIDSRGTSSFKKGMNPLVEEAQREHWSPNVSMGAKFDRIISRMRNGIRRIEN